jgi:hypothetical protein
MRDPDVTDCMVCTLAPYYAAFLVKIKTIPRMSGCGLRRFILVKKRRSANYRFLSFVDALAQCMVAVHPDFLVSIMEANSGRLIRDTHHSHNSVSEAFA